MSTELQITVVEVARALGDGWSAGEFDPDLLHIGKVIGPKGAQITFNAWPVPGRFEITGNLERQFKPYAAPRFKITVAADKTPGKIAGDIRRRILDAGYWGVLAETLERKRQAEEEEATRQALHDALLKILGSKTFDVAPNHIKIGSVSDFKVWGDAEVRSGEVKFELHVPLAQAQRFASMIAAIQQEKVVRHN